MSARFRDGQFVGVLRETRLVSGLTLAETEYQSGFLVAAHAHENALVCLVLDGGFTERTGNITAACDPGSVIYQPADEPHSHVFHRSGARCFNIQLGDDWRDRMAAVGLQTHDMPASSHRDKPAWLAAQLYREFRSYDTASALSIEGYILALLAEVSRSGETGKRARTDMRPAWLMRIVERLHAGFLDSGGLTDLAHAEGVDPTHVARTFRRHFHCNMSEYVRRLRIEHARQLLAGSGQSLSTIAHASGFADQAHFSRVFRAQTGLTPGEYRKLLTR